MGIKNVLALTGDLPSLGDHPMAKPVFDLDSVTLLQTISTLNGGKDLSGNELKGVPAFFPGAVVKVENNTEASFELQVAKFAKKVAAGAKFFQTQACYEPKSFEKLMRRVEKFKVPVMVGVIPLKNAGSAKYMNANVAGIHVPDDLIDIMAKASKEDREKVGLEMAANLIRKMKDMCQGVHIMAVAWEKKVPEIMALAGL
jgi:methylenetetrahydrofolate reductase (NADPH)